MSSFWMYPKCDASVDMKLVVPPSPPNMESMIAPEFMCVGQSQKTQSNDTSVSGMSSRPSSSRSRSVMSPFVGPLTQFYHSFDQSVVESIQVNPRIRQHNHRKVGPQTPRSVLQKVNQLNVQIPQDEANLE